MSGNADVIPVTIPEGAPDAGAVLESLVIPHAPDSVALGGVSPRDPVLNPTGAPAAVDSDAAKLDRAKPGRKKQLVSKHRSKSELLVASRELDAENARLRERLTQFEGGPLPGAEGMTPAELAKQVDVALDATIELTSNIAAAYYGDHCRVEKEERVILRDAWAPILRAYAPRLGTALPWIGAISTTAMVVLPRVNKTREILAQKKAEKVAPISAPAPTGEPAPAAPPITKGARYSGTESVAPLGSR